MPAFTSLSIADGLATPVTHTFSPVNIIGDLASYEDRVSGISEGFNRVTVSTSRPNRTSKLHKVRVKIFRPTLETLGNNSNGFVPPQTKAYDCAFDGTFFLPSRSVIGDRADILAYAKNLIASAYMTSLVKDLESVY